jgi:hypothetical protein
MIKFASSTSLKLLDHGRKATVASEPLIKRLVHELGVCNSDGYCAYHDKKRDNQAIRLPCYATNALVDDCVVTPDQRLIGAIRAMRAECRIAGSWQLMGEQRKWFDSRLAGHRSLRADRVRIAMLGVPGATHLRETVQLIAQRLPTTASIEYCVVEKCIRPLIDIANYLRKMKYVDVQLSTTDLKAIPLASLSRGRVTFQLLHCDLTQICPFPTQWINLACSHLLFSFMNEVQASKVLRGVASCLHPTGCFLLAEDMLENHRVDMDYRMAHAGLVVADTAKTWNLYALTHAECNALMRRQAIMVKNDVLLLELRKRHDADHVTTTQPSLPK